MIYSQLLTSSFTGKLSYVSKWEKDLELELEASECKQIWNCTKSASLNESAIETNYKVITRWYLVPARIAKYVQNYPEHCFRGCSSTGTYFHIWWSCPIAQSFWSEIFHIINILSEKKISLDPKTALLNLKPDNLSLTQFKLIIQLLTAAKQTLAKAWKSPNLPLNEVVNRMNNAMIHAKMMAIDTDTITRFEKIWKPWITYTIPNVFNNDVLQPW